MVDPSIDPIIINSPFCQYNWLKNWVKYVNIIYVHIIHFSTLHSFSNSNNLQYWTNAIDESSDSCNHSSLSSSRLTNATEMPAGCNDDHSRTKFCSELFTMNGRLSDIVDCILIGRDQCEREKDFGKDDFISYSHVSNQQRREIPLRSESNIWKQSNNRLHSSNHQSISFFQSHISALIDAQLMMCHKESQMPMGWYWVM